jgi:hypothetical protein
MDSRREGRWRVPCFHPGRLPTSRAFLSKEKGRRPPTRESNPLTPVGPQALPFQVDSSNTNFYFHFYFVNRWDFLTSIELSNKIALG